MHYQFTLRRALLVAAAFGLVATNLFALDLPPTPKRWFTDKASVVDAANADALNYKLKTFEQKSGTSFIIYIFPTLENETIEDFTIRSIEKWKRDHEKYGNGLILFVFIKEKKVRIEIGNGLEGAITDAFASRVIREFMAPHFQKDDYSGGLNAAADVLIAHPEKQAAEAAAVALHAEGRRQAEQRKRSEVAARSAAFVRTNGVAHFVTIQQLVTNPFVYQGQVVAIPGDFEQMHSAAQGLFSSHGRHFVVSGIPTAMFTQRSAVLVAGRVLGKIEIKVSSLGSTLVPHLSFVGKAFCQQPGCGDYDIKP